jgi:hypothetical protein
MSSKSKSKKDRIKLTEIAKEDYFPSTETAASKIAPVKKPSKSLYKVKITANYDGKNPEKYESALEALIDSVAADGWKLVSVNASIDAQNLILFFKRAK